MPRRSENKKVVDENKIWRYIEGSKESGDQESGDQEGRVRNADI